MGDPNPDKAAVVAEVREKLEASDGALLTEYRGMDVPALAALRKELRAAGGEYKIYKNTLVRIAAREHDLDLDDLLTGPTAVAFVNAKEDGSAGDAAAVAKALKEFAKSNENLVLKGGVLDGAVLSADDIKALAELPSRDVLLSQIAGLLQAPLADFVGLLDAVPRDFSYALQALIDKGGAGEAGAAPSEASDDSGDDAAEDASEEPAEAVAEATEENDAADAGDADGEAAGDNNEEEE